MSKIVFGKVPITPQQASLVAASCYALSFVQLIPLQDTHYQSGIRTAIFQFFFVSQPHRTAYGARSNCTLWFGSILRKEMRDWAPYDPRRSCVDSALVPVHQTCGQPSSMLHSSHPSLHLHFSRQFTSESNRRVKTTIILFFLRDMPYRCRVFPFGVLSY